MAYQRSSTHEHILDKPGMWIGETAPAERTVFVFYQGKLQQMKVTCPRGFERIFIEVISNAIDNAGRSRDAGVPPGKIYVTITPTHIMVRNEGVVIPPTKTGDDYNAVLCFGVPLAGSNLKGAQRSGSGTNGVGAKAANIFSKRFSIQIEDPWYHSTYSQNWYQNMYLREEPTIVQYNGTTGSTTVYFEPDFPRFFIGGITDEICSLLSFHALCATLTAKVPVIINGVEYPVLTFQKFVSTYFQFEIKNYIHHTVPSKTNPNQLEYEMIIFENTGHNTMSFINGIHTPSDGIHVQSMIEGFSKSCVATIENVIFKGKDKEDQKSGITLHNIRRNVGYIVSTWLPNPAWESQSKDKFVSYRLDNNPGTRPITKYEVPIPDSLLAQVKKWPMIIKMIEEISSSKIKAESGRKLGKRQRLKKGTHANFASGNWERRKQCTLLITEGDSAVGYFKKMKALNPTIMDTYGVLPFRGKCMNVLNANSIDYCNNKEYLSLITAVNLDIPGTDYTIEKNFQTLRYSSVLILADSDVDGKHITGLIIAFFYCKYPSLLYRGFVKNYLSPILRATLQGQTFAFYTASCYAKWAKDTPNSSLAKVKYYKGLGTSDDDDVKKDVQEPRIVTFMLDPQAPDTVNRAFNGDLADVRKLWICSYAPNEDIPYVAPPYQPISQFIENEFIEYPIDNVRRSIPSLMDGWKRVMKKIFYGLFKKPKKNNEFTKVAQLALACSKISGYHNGDGSIADTLMGLCQSYPGSNNIPLIQGSGSFATRDGGKKDAAAARYPNARLSPITRVIYPKEDDPLLKATFSDGYYWEPEMYYGIIPMILVNGCQGVASGWSTFVPNHHPIDVINWIEQYISGVSPQDIEPWYRGFKGTIGIYYSNKKQKRCRIDDNVRTWALQNEEIQEVLEEIESGATVNVFYSEGVYFYDGSSRTITIKEIPVLMLVDNYVNHLHDMMEKGKITDFRNISAGDNIHIELYGWKGDKYPTVKDLALRSTQTLSNMYLLDERNRPRYYPTTTSILESFVQIRIRKYEERRNYQIKLLQSILLEKQQRRYYITCVKENKIPVFCSRATREAVLTNLSIPFDVPKKVNFDKCSDEMIAALDESIIEVQQQIQTLINTDPRTLWMNDLRELKTKLHAMGFSVEREAIPSRAPIVI